MALSPQLLNFKSSGVYRLEFDKSQTANINVETLRLMVGHSKKGPYNTPVLIDSVETLTNVFGNIDKSLEKKGMFFHRSCIEALSRGPILALNLEQFTQGDVASYQSPVTCGGAGAIGITSDSGTSGYATFFDNDKFMIPSDAQTLATIVPDDDHILNFVNIKQEPITIIVRQAQDVKEFDLTAREWYGVGNVPEYLNDFDKLSDFMIDVFVFKGEFDSVAMSNDPIYSAYFTEDGLDKTKLAQFANLRQVSLIAQYTGSILPGFKDLEGRNLYIESIVNAEARRTGLFCAVNEDDVMDEQGTKVDFVGHVHDSNQNYELLSHYVPSEAREISENFVGGTVANNSSNFTVTYDNIVATVTSASASGTEIEYTTSTPHGIQNGQTVTITGLTPSLFNITGTATNVATNKFKIVNNLTAQDTVPGSPTGTATVLINVPSPFPIKVGHYVDSNTEDRLARVNRVAKAPINIDGETIFTVYTDIEPAYDGRIIKSYEEASLVYKTFVLPKANITGKEISDYLSVLSGGNGIYDALIDKDIIDFRYVVDTFTSFDENGLNNKSNLSQLAKDRQNAAAILNAPTIEDFKKSDDPSFTDEFGGFDTAYIAAGGNQDKNPTKIYALPSINQGANYAFYYGPGLIVSDNGKDIIVPPAAYVCNNYIDKYTNALPWSIVAGPRRGVVAGTNVKGVEYSFDKGDRDILEPFGINPIVFQRGTGLTILGNKTAQQSIKSALSSAHVREVLIYIQDGMANILKDYVFEFNTAQTRLEIKTLADSFLESVKQDSGVYEFKNVMDSTNNTNEVIDNNMGIIDTYVEPVKGLEIVVHRTTVLNTGEISSS
jgi:hypothetical protein